MQSGTGPEPPRLDEPHSRRTWLTTLSGRRRIAAVLAVALLAIGMGTALVRDADRPGRQLVEIGEFRLPDPTGGNPDAEASAPDAVSLHGETVYVLHSVHDRHRSDLPTTFVLIFL